MKNEWKDMLNDAFYAPEPVKKKEFLRSIRQREMSSFEMILQQAAYIRIHVWIFAVMIIAFAVFGAATGLGSTQHIITMIMPFTASFSVIEAQRSKWCGMTELEMATRFSLRSVVLARMTILGAVTFVVLCVISPVISVAFDQGAVLTAVRILIPYLVTMIISLEAERSVIGRKTGYCPLMIAAVVSVFIYWMAGFETRMLLRYLNILESWGILIALGLLALTFAEQWKTINNVEAFA